MRFPRPKTKANSCLLWCTAPSSIGLQGIIWNQDGSCLHHLGSSLLDLGHQVLLQYAERIVFRSKDRVSLLSCLEFVLLRATNHNQQFPRYIQHQSEVAIWRNLLVIVLWHLRRHRKMGSQFWLWNLLLIIQQPNPNTWQPSYLQVWTILDHHEVLKLYR